MGVVPPLSSAICLATSYHIKCPECLSGSCAKHEPQNIRTESIYGQILHAHSVTFLMRILLKETEMHISSHCVKIFR